MGLFQFKAKHQSKSDEDLLQEYQRSGDYALLGDLYARHMPLVYGLCLKYLKDRGAAQDAVITLFEKLALNLDKHEVRNFKSWLHVVAKNHCLMELRKAKSNPEFSISGQNEWANFVENSIELHPIDEELNGQTEQALNDCIEKLKTEQRACIRLFYFENKSYREICLQLELNEKRVKSVIQNGKRNLKICLDRKHETTEQT